MTASAKRLRPLAVMAMVGALLAASGGARAQDMPLTQGQFGDLTVEAAIIEPGRLRLDIRAARPVKLSDIAVEWNGREAALVQWNAYPSPGATTAIMLLIDSSDQRRQPQIERMARQLLQLEALAKPHQRFGVATYDSGLTIWLPPEATADKLAPVLAGLQATGKASELYKSTLNAIKRLAELPASRRAIFLFSDGLAEDAGYRAEDVITAARAAGVVIFSFGTDSAANASTANLQQLSRGSGGAHSAISDDPADLRGAMTNALAALDSGGVGFFTVPVGESETAERAMVRWLESGKPAEGVLVFQRRAVTPQIAQEPPPAPPPPPAEWIPWVAGGGAVVTAGLLFLLVARVRAARRRGLAGEPVAWLDLLVQERRRVGVDRLPFRIGRNSDNALVLPLDTISSYHAEIARDEQGQLAIRDMNSKNGLYVNLTKIHSIALNNGDLIEMGEIKIRFRSA